MYTTLLKQPFVYNLVFPIAGFAAASVRGRRRNEDVWQDENQRKSPRLPNQQKILWQVNNKQKQSPLVEPIKVK